MTKEISLIKHAEVQPPSKNLTWLTPKSAKIARRPGWAARSKSANLIIEEMMADSGLRLFSSQKSYSRAPSLTSWVRLLQIRTLSKRAIWRMKPRLAKLWIYPGQNTTCNKKARWGWYRAIRNKERSIMRPCHLSKKLEEIFSSSVIPARAPNKASR